MANINDIVFMKPSVDDTQADRMRIPAAANAMGKVVHNMEQAMDEDEGDELEFIAAAHALIIVDAALTAMEEDDASDLHEQQQQQQAAAAAQQQQQLHCSCSKQTRSQTRSTKQHPVPRRGVS
jgi:phosphoenolpyruvate-protein kinase (PTS system EI component)